MFLEWMLLCFFSGCHSCVCVCVCVCVCACVRACVFLFPAVTLAKHTSSEAGCTQMHIPHYALCIHVHVLYLRSEWTLWTHFTLFLEIRWLFPSAR